MPSEEVPESVNKGLTFLIGRLVCNFNSAELVVSAWIEALTNDPEFVKIIMYEGRLPNSSTCIDIAKRLVEIRCDEKEKADILEALQALTELSFVRNTVCHNPVLYGPSGGEDSKKVIDWRKGKRNYSIEDIDEAGSRCRDISYSLGSLYVSKFGHDMKLGTNLSK